MCNQSGNTAYDGYGVIPTVLWGNRRFNSIRNATSRLMYIYMRTGPEFSPSGIFHIDPMSLAFSSCCLVDEISQYMKPLQDIGLVKWDGQVVWLTGVREHFVTTANDIQMERINADVARVIPTSTVWQEYVEEYGLSPRAKLDQDDMELAIAKVIDRSVMLFDWNEKELSRKLVESGHTPDEINEIFARPNGAWYIHDWRGQKGQTPNFTNVVKELEKLLKKSDVEQVVRYHVDTEKLEKMLGGLIGANKGVGFSKAKIVSEFGQPIWQKLVGQATWREWLEMKSTDIKWEIKKALA